jgi:Skp family chaperone for outer membrane proteins
MIYKMRLTLLMAFLMSFGAMAQRPAEGGRSNMEKLKAMKVGVITEKLDLTPSEAKGFWPIYNKFDEERQSLNRAMRAKMRSSRDEESTEKSEIARQDEIFDLKEKELALTKRYRPDFLKVISAKQYSDLVLAEREFNQMLLRELRERRNTRSVEK